MAARTFVLGDLHNNYKGLMQLFEKVNFDYKKDSLYFIGDIFDGIANQPRECLSELMKVKNLHPCIGNHDLWVRYWIETGRINKTWLKSGGDNTLKLLSKDSSVKDKLVEYFWTAKYWYSYKDFFLCHAGFDTRKSVINQKAINFAINRSLWQKAIVNDSQKRLLKFNFSNMDFTFSKVIIGHTPTISHKPETVSNVINIDTGSGNGGRLTLMDLNTMEYFQSDFTKKLYKKT